MAEKASVQQGFAEADHVFEHTYYVHQVQQAPIEPHIAISWWDSRRAAGHSHQHAGAIPRAPHGRAAAGAAGAAVSGSSSRASAAALA
jgi:hypothetical protein